MRKYLLTLFLIFGFVSSVSARQVDRYFVYGATSEVNYSNLNGNFNNIINVINGGLDNINPEDGFNFIEVLGSLPLAGEIGRTVYLTTDDLLYFDDGTAWHAVATYLGTPVQGDILYFDGSDWIRLVAGTTGYPLLTQGAGANPSWTQLNLTSAVTGVLPIANGGTGSAVDNLIYDGDAAGGLLGGTYPNPGLNEFIRAGLYFEPDPTCIVAFQSGIRPANKDISPLENVLTLNHLAEADLVDGKVSAKCLDFDGANDYVLVAHSADQQGQASTTLEAWVYRDTSGNTDYILGNAVQNRIFLAMTDTQITGGINGTVGNEAWAVNHGLSNNGIDQWVYISVGVTMGSLALVNVNGVLEGNGDGNGAGVVADSANGINIGADSANGNKFHGKLDGVRILRRLMSTAEALARYNTFK